MRKNLIYKFKNSFANEGILIATLKIIKYPINVFRKNKFKNEILSIESIEDRFTWIYKNNYWRSGESASGTGSTLKCTENLRKELPGLFRTYSIKKIFDAPCGDFNWMSHLLPVIEVEYIGGDIVRELIDDLNSRYKSKNVSFVGFDLIKEIPPEADLMICRDCLFHFSYKDAKAVLENFVESKIAYLLTTTHKNSGGSFVNANISTGDFRYIDLFSHPYNFPANPLCVIEDWIAPDPERQMCLWSREQIVLALRSFQL
ncbi:class I SAM-dependent methyltransferase [Pandoraea fibrosis]|uniref:Methyltransferase domain-containing protein n=1 Tax=Pandoraea fibrosis TaxID=1891094 RepID=A0A5E4W9Q9_9BURK|nr:class I SAM-dependent methyltransferase [Pandoraea fibrosis]VVE21737.1 hypothetical protein PFI31113_03146 [Pandoraea fibrosis]